MARTVRNRAKRSSARLRSRRYLALAAASLVMAPGVAAADGVVPRTGASIPDATVSVIDPETGSSAGGASEDLRIAVGDIVSFRFPMPVIPDQEMNGIQSYLTQYVPDNTEVVGVRLVDASGNTVEPRYPGLSRDGCYGGSNCNTATGSIAQLYADSGVFYATGSDVLRDPSNAEPTLINGIELASDPSSAADVLAVVGGSPPVFAHNSWDAAQALAYGVDPGNTPFGYGSPVAGPGTFYPYEVGGSEGPWNRVAYPGSLTGSGVSGGSDAVTRMSIPYAGGADVSPNDPLDQATTALRFAAGEGRVGQPLFAEVAVRVTGTPLDPQIGNVVCAEAFGYERSSTSFSTGPSNPWSGFVPVPACVPLDLKFDVTSDESMAVTDDPVGYEIGGRNLSMTSHTNARVTMSYPARLSLGIPPAGTQFVSCPAGFFGSCLRWDLGTLDPSESFLIEPDFTVEAGAATSTEVRAMFTSDQLPSGHRTSSFLVTHPVPSYEVTATSVSPNTAAGGIATVALNVANVGSGTGDLEELQVTLPAGFSVRAGTFQYAGNTVGCSAGCGTSRQSFSVSQVLTPGEINAVTFQVDVPLGATSPGLHQVWISLFGSVSGFGVAETFFPDVATLPVGAVRSDPPVVACPEASAGAISGITTEADDTQVRVLLNLDERASVLSSGGAWEVTDLDTTFGALYAGLEVRATAQAPGELESEPSQPCSVLPPPTHELTVAKAGAGSGTVTSSFPGVNCGSDCTGTYSDGTVVILSAVASGGSRFVEWSGACTGSGACQVTMDQARAVTATFAPLLRRPDGHIKYSSDNSFLGNDVYNKTAQGQTRKVRGRRGTSKSFVARFENDGDAVDSYMVKGTLSGKNAKARYFVGQTNITKQVVAGAYRIKNLAAGARRSLRIVISIGARATRASIKAALVRASSVGDPTKVDAVKAAVRVR